MNEIGPSLVLIHLLHVTLFLKVKLIDTTDVAITSTNKTTSAVTRTTCTTTTTTLTMVLDLDLALRPVYLNNISTI